MSPDLCISEAHKPPGAGYLVQVHSTESLDTCYIRGKNIRMCGNLVEALTKDFRSLTSPVKVGDRRFMLACSVAAFATGSYRWYIG